MTTKLRSYLVVYSFEYGTDTIQKNLIVESIHLELNSFLIRDIQALLKPTVVRIVTEYSRLTGYTKSYGVEDAVILNIMPMNTSEY